ncbi:MAG TPA: YceI family protein [Steroidobacteraceae bacterium]|jgi:polyisoprenoid-binding protein YceI
MILRSAALASAVLACLAVPPLALSAGAAAHFTQDLTKSSLEYSFMQAGAKNKGAFRKYTVTLDFAADNLGASKLDVVIDMASLDTGDKERDETLRGSDLFDVKKNPQARFTSTQIVKTAAGFEAVGKLTMRGVTHDTHVPFTLRTATEQGKPVNYLTGLATVKRLDFGIGQGEWKSTEWVGNEVGISYSVRLPAAGP